MAVTAAATPASFAVTLTVHLLLQWQDCGRGLECYQVKSDTDKL